MIRDKAIIIIAVSKYNGGYRDLPGAITSARRIREWAEQKDEDCNYKVLYLADDVYEKIDIQLVRKEVTDFIANNFIDRLVVYFSGHGICRGLRSQFWLLTDAAKDDREGIEIEGFRRRLLQSNIGKFNDKAPGQLCIIGDACRNASTESIEFSGDKILTSTSKSRRKKSIQLDKFFSTRIGDYSFQINGDDDQSSYCLFSQVLIDGLSGRVEDAIEREYHQFKPVVTNHKLQQYLEQEVRIRANEIQEEMEPDIITGIHPPFNFYRMIKGTPSNLIASPQAGQIDTATTMSTTKNDVQIKENQESFKRAFKERTKSISEITRADNSFNYFNPNITNRETIFSAVVDFIPTSVAVPRDVQVKLFNEGEYYKLVTANHKDLPILIRQDEKWILIPHYPNILTVIFDDFPGDILFFKPGVNFFLPDAKDEYWHDLWDTHLSDFFNIFGSVPLRAADAQKFADKIRIGKEIFPHQSVTAGYLYEFSGDYDNIARTAHYMVNNTDTVPFDLALLCADKIWWKKENHRLTAYANLPPVDRLEVTYNNDNRPYYTRTEFKAHHDVKLWGIAPIFSEGWSFMQTELYLDIPEEIRQIGDNISGRSATNLTEEGLEMFLEAFDYRIITAETADYEVFLEIEADNV